ncbi:nuclear transport factor 2 family protein [Halorubrum vacuolatum]|nr:nuclear transport factor 2 family protein [Halorubrum vacuolatum]
MHTRQTNKSIIHTFSESIRRTAPGSTQDLLSEYYHNDIVWHGPSPINTLRGRDELRNEFWDPFLEAFPDLQKDDYILFAGEFDGDEWVCATGNFVGTFENDWLNVRRQTR